jgi:hypothetical protein
MLLPRRFFLIIFILSSYFNFILGVTITNGSDTNWLDQDFDSIRRIIQAFEIIRGMTPTGLNITLNKNAACPRNSGTNLHLHRMLSDRWLFTSDIFDGGRALFGLNPSYTSLTFYGAGNKIFV